MEAGTKFQDAPQKDRISSIMASYFPRLGRELVSGLAESYVGFSDDELSAIFTPGQKVLSRGQMVLTAYLQAAPEVFRLIDHESFNNWLLIARKVSVLSVSCCEGFFNSSAGIIRKDIINDNCRQTGKCSLRLLDMWTGIGIGYAEKSKWLAISYFKYTGGVFVATDLDEFMQLVATGFDISNSNVNVAEEYFRHLFHVQSLLSNDEFILWCSIIKRMLDTKWLSAVDIISATPLVLVDVAQNKRRMVLDELASFVVYDGNVALALFKNLSTLSGKISDDGLKEWVANARRIAKKDPEASISFMNWSPEIVPFLEPGGITEWVDKALDASDKQALRAYMHDSFKGLGKAGMVSEKEDRSLLLDTGIRLAKIGHGSLESYFENAPAALKLFTMSDFRDWLHIGIVISGQSSVYGSGFFKNYIIGMKHISPSYHGDIIKITLRLLENDWLLAAAFSEHLPSIVEKLGPEDIKRWAMIGMNVHAHSRNLAVDFFSHAPDLLKGLGVAEVEEWAQVGIGVHEDNPLLGRPYFTLMSRSSRDLIDELTGSVALQRVAPVLRYYALGLSGINFSILSKKNLQIEVDDSISPVVAGRSIYLAPRIKRFGGFEDNFRIYKLSVMHEVGHAQFSSDEVPLAMVADTIKTLQDKYAGSGTYMDERYQERLKGAVDSVDIGDIIALFQNSALAANILGLLEDARVEYLIMDVYRGVRSDLERIRYQMLLERPAPKSGLEEFVEAILWISTGHEPAFIAGPPSGNMLEFVDRLRSSLQGQVFRVDSSILDCLLLTVELYSLLEDGFGPLDKIEYEIMKNLEYRGMGLGAYRKTDPLSSRAHDNMIRRFIPESEVDLSSERELPKEQKTRCKSNYAKDKDWRTLGSYRYDEWDINIGDYRPDWCTVTEVEPTGASTGYYKDASERYRNEIALIKRVFSTMRPEEFRRMRGQADGTEIDIDAYIDALIDRRGGINPEDRLYVRWDKHVRDVATLFLVDVSASTRKVLDIDGRSIVDVEKDALIVMIQALESIGDKYAIYAFSGNTKDDVEYFIIKDFQEGLSDDVARRIDLLEPVANTRLGPVIRHSITKLKDVDAMTKVIILLSDGEPYDTCTGEGAYQGHVAEEDTRMAIQEARSKGMHFFCITVDNDPGDYLKNIFSDVGYTIIDDARLLPESLTLLYKKITT